MSNPDSHEDPSCVQPGEFREHGLLPDVLPRRVRSSATQQVDTNASQVLEPPRTRQKPINLQGALLIQKVLRQSHQLEGALVLDTANVQLYGNV